MVFKAVFEDHGESFIIHWQGVGRSSFAHPSFRRTGCVWISVRAFELFVRLSGIFLALEEGIFCPYHLGI